MTGIIDIHSHILPGLDDGSSDMRESIHMLAACREAGNHSGGGDAALFPQLSEHKP